MGVLPSEEVPDEAPERDRPAHPRPGQEKVRGISHLVPIHDSRGEMQHREGRAREILTTPRAVQVDNGRLGPREVPSGDDVHPGHAGLFGHERQRVFASLDGLRDFDASSLPGAEARSGVLDRVERELGLSRSVCVHDEDLEVPVPI